MCLATIGQNKNAKEVRWVVTFFAVDNVIDNIIYIHAQYLFISISTLYFSQTRLSIDLEVKEPIKVKGILMMRNEARLKFV